VKLAKVSKCPYKPPDGSGGGVCPYGDEAEDAALQTQIDRCLTQGLAGMDELFHLAQSGEMIIHDPLQEAVGLVLDILEKNSFQLSEENTPYVAKAGEFISRLIHYTETEHVVQHYFDKLVCVIFRVLLTPNAVAWFSVYSTILTRLYVIDKTKSLQFLGRVRENAVFRESMVCVSADTEFMSLEHRANFVNLMLNP
jgi:hypothetical protein